SCTKNIRIIAKNKADCTILKNGSVFENTTFDDVVTSIQNETAQSKYDCHNTQMLIDFVHPKTGAVIENLPLNFCSFRTITLADGSTKKALILQFARTLWKGFAPFGTNGFNRWKYSQLRKWLNASGANWFSSSYTADILSPHEGSYTDDGVKGFLSCLPPALVELLVPVKIVTQAFFDDYNEDTAIDDPDYIDGFDADITYDKVFIPSFSEMTVTAGSDEFFPDTVFEGATWDYYSALSSEADINRDINGEACSVVTRSAYLDGTAKIIYADSLTHVAPGDVYSANSAPAPAFVLC
ncbi:MAG: hypothetical protein IJQ08_08670, partial [Synergistaceae bacterium]|nr:hypothetical protein [Synergistaceae bacterium]